MKKLLIGATSILMLAGCSSGYGVEHVENEHGEDYVDVVLNEKDNCYYAEFGSVEGQLALSPLENVDGEKICTDGGEFNE